MLAIELFMQSPWLAPLTGVLLHFLWQGTLLGFIALAVLRMFDRRRAELRYWFCVGVLCLMAAAPLATLSISAKHSYTATSHKREAELSPHASAATFVIAPTPGSGEHSSFAEGIDPNTSEQRSAGHSPLFWMQCRIFIAMGWLLGVGLMSLRLAAAGAAALRLQWFGIRAAPNGLVERARILARRMSCVTPWSIGVSTLVASPLIVGFIRPLILIPATAFSSLSPTELDAILLHELAHLRRFDLWINFFQALMETIFFFHPAVWWLSRQIAAAGGTVDFVAAYERGAPQFDADQQALARQAATDGSVWLLSSSEAVAHLAAALPGQHWGQARALATHPRIAQAAQAAGFGSVNECRPAFNEVAASIESLHEH